MHELVASRDQTFRLCATPDRERRQQMEDFELLIEKLIERANRVDKELRDVTRERDELLEEVKRLKGE